MRTLAWVVVAVVLIAGCGGGSDSSSSGDGGSGGSGSSSAQSAGDRQYIDPFQDSAADVACLSKREVQQKIDSIASRVQNPERKQRAVRAVRNRGC